MRTPSIAIIGAGFSGIGMAVKLRKEGITSFTIYERLPDAGGCWRSNAFPGAEVDTESDVYRYSFKPYPWSRSHARREELLTYFDEVIDEHELRDRIRFGVSIESIEWTRAGGYQLTTGSGSTIRADVVISAVGLFSEPQIPAWPGLDRFTGDVVHTAEWRDELDLSQKKVAVVGTGSTSASLVPAIAEQVDQLYVFQRQPGWILPKPVTQFADDERLRRAQPSAAQWNRLKALYRIRRAIKGGRAKKIGTAQNRAVQRVAENFLQKTFADRPDLLAALTPDYPVYGKRLVRSSEFYPALKRPNVTLVPRGITEVRESSVVDEAGVEHEVDTILLATGFKAAQFLSGLRIIGRDRTELQDFWRTDATAFLGLMVPKFPNFFILYGPNTNGSGAHLFVLECQMAFVAGVVKRMARSRSTVAEVRAGHFRAYEQWLSKQWEDSALLSTHNYFRGASGNVVTNWPRGFGLYYLLTRIGRARSVRFSRTGPTLQRVTPAGETADARSTSSGR